MGIVEIEHVGANAIQQRGMEHVRPLGAAEQRRLACPEKGRQGRHRIGHRLMLRTAQSAADPIEERAFGFMAHRLRHICEARQGDEPRQLPREVVREFRLLEYRVMGLRLCRRAYKRVADRRSRDGQSCRGAGFAC